MNRLYDTIIFCLKEFEKCQNILKVMGQTKDGKMGPNACRNVIERF